MASEPLCISTDDLRVNAAYITRWLQGNPNIMRDFEDLHGQLMDIVPEDMLARRYEDIIAVETAYIKTVSGTLV